MIRYDLKTIVSTGWHHSLIPDDYLIAEFFQDDADAIEALEAGISEAQSELAEAVEAAQEAADYQPEEDEKITATVIKKELKAQIDDLKGSPSEAARSELRALQTHDGAIKDIEKRIKAGRTEKKARTEELELKLQLKRLGGDEFEAESRALISQIEEQLANLDSANKDDKKRFDALHKDRAALETRLTKADALLAWIGGQLTDAEARSLILKKLYDQANTELGRYLNAEQRSLTHAIDNLWDKYAVSSRELENGRNETLKTLDGFLARLGYV
jgi:type I restriction enzyme M protein